MEPPIQTEYFRSGGAIILILIDEGARAVISFFIRSGRPGYMVVPPDCRRLASKHLSDICKSAYHDDVAVKVLSDINIALDDGIVSGDVDTAILKTQDTRLEESLRSTEPLVPNGNNLAIRQLI